MPGESYWYKIEQLDATNWLAWKRRTEAILRERKLLGHIDGTSDRPESADKSQPPTDADIEKQEKWDEEDGSAQN
jgi:hypothetical protein